MPYSFLDGGGAMGSAIRAFPWSDSPLGPTEGWPPVLKTTVALMLASQFPKCLMWGPELTTIYNDAFRPILGDKPEALGRPFSEVWAEAWPTVGPIAEAALRGEATFIENFPVTVQRRGYPEEAFFTFCYSPVRDETGKVLGVLDTVVETTDTVVTQRQMRLLNNELSHRMKNMLTVVQAIASQSFAPGTSYAGARRTFEQRLAALGAAHDVLTRDEWSDAPIREIVDRALAPHIGNRGSLTVDGPPVHLGGRQAMALALGVHELATNAVKYGALKSEKGRVRIAWEAGVPGSDDPFTLQWAESDGPAVSPPSSKGFGGKLIERVLPKEFGGKASVSYAPHGFRYELRTTMKRLSEAEASA